MAAIGMLDITRVEGKGALKGFATIRLGETEIRDLRIVQQDNPGLDLRAQFGRTTRGKTTTNP